MNKLAMIAAERAVPRYTSYPTAPHFTDAVDAATYGAWLADLPADASLSLYLHVPFCTELCHYCGCNTKAVRRRKPVDAYAARLVEEIELLAAALPGRRVAYLHWGGGTPSMLGAARLAELSALLARRFDLGAIREHAIELDPRYVTKELAEGLVAVGVSRVSLGVQDVSEHVQRAIGRIQPVEAVAQSVERLRAAGIANMNFDLMYGLPHQGLGDVEESTRVAASFRPQRLAVFGYAHVPWFKKHQRLIDAAALPGAAERLAQAEAVRGTLIAQGYEPVGFDHFALPGDEMALAAREGRLGRNFQGYVVDDADALIGLGTSAIGRLPQGYVQNAADTAGYSRAVEAGGFATVRGIALSGEDRLRAALIERLMCDLAVDLDAFGGADAFAAEIAELIPLADAGLAAVDGARVRVTEQGRPFVRLVAAAFDTYLREGRAAHSRAV